MWLGDITTEEYVFPTMLPTDKYSVASEDREDSTIRQCKIER